VHFLRQHVESRATVYTSVLTRAAHVC